VGTLIRAPLVLPDAETRLEDGAVLCEDGIVAWIGPAAEAPEAAETVELEGAVVTPGLVNAHAHLDLSHGRGAEDHDGDFVEWVKSVVAARRSADADAVHAAAVEALESALARGTTSFGDIAVLSSFDAVVAAFERTGARGRVFVEALDLRPERADDVFAEVWERAEMRDLPPRVDTGLAPHAPYSVSRELLAQASAMAAGHGRPLAIHVGETLEELAFLRHGIGPLRELHREYGTDDPDLEPWGGLPQLLGAKELDGAPLVLVHCNYVRPSDVPGGAFVAYCPTAHAYFGHPEHPVLELLEEGVRVALGSDSAMSGGTVDALSEIRWLAGHRPDLEPRAVFRMATEWGARALGLDTGVLHVGRPADIAAFRPEAEDGDAFDYGVLGRPGTRCVLTMVGGDVLWRTAEED